MPFDGVPPRIEVAGQKRSALMLSACSGVVVRPNPTNPAYMGVFAPGGPGWTSNSGFSTTLCVECW
jgi:hypothetical protein